MKTIGSHVSRTDRTCPLPAARSLLSRAALLCVGFLAASAHADVFQLYDASSGLLPNTSNPQWLTFQSTGASQSYDGQKVATNFDSTASTLLYGGYSNYSLTGQLVNPSFPELNRHAGYTIGFTVEIMSESHGDRPERAGFSVIAVSSDVAIGVASSIEIGFQDGRVFSQSNDFGATVADVNDLFDPVGTGFIAYELTILGSQYELTADGQTVLSGVLHDHHGQVTPPLGLPSPYEIPSFIFLGDDTTSASGNFNLRDVSVATPVPEPSSLVLLSLGAVAGLALGARRRRRGESVM